MSRLRLAGGNRPESLSHQHISCPSRPIENSEEGIRGREPFLARATYQNAHSEGIGQLVAPDLSPEGILRRCVSIK